MSLPTLTADQRAAALTAAQRICTARAGQLDQVRAGEITVLDLIGRTAADPDVVGGIRLRTALLAISGVGAHTADAVMFRCGIVPTRRLRGLGSRQRAALAEWHAREIG